MMGAKTRGQANYEGFYAFGGGKVPPWEAEDEKIQAAWTAGADKVVDHHSEELIEGLAAFRTACSPIMKAAVAALRGLLQSWAGQR